MKLNAKHRKTMKATISTFFILINLSAFFTFINAQPSGIKPGDRVPVFAPGTSENGR